MDIREWWGLQQISVSCLMGQSALNFTGFFLPVSLSPMLTKLSFLKIIFDLSFHFLITQQLFDWFLDFGRAACGTWLPMCLALEAWGLHWQGSPKTFHFSQEGGSLDFYDISSIFICWQRMQTFQKCIAHQIKIDQ